MTYLVLTLAVSFHPCREDSVHHQCYQLVDANETKHKATTLKQYPAHFALANCQAVYIDYFG